MKKRMISIIVLCAVAVFALTACYSSAPAESVTPGVSVETSEVKPEKVSTSWTDPLTGNVLVLTEDGKFEVQDSTGALLATGTYQAGERDVEYTVTYEDGSSGSLVIKDQAIELVDDKTGTVTVFESKQPE